ncbi:molybdenum cofactor biosynthesis protein MoaE [Helicobacter sp. MIT 05-5294]|uniref:molybdenum cofactor biosynthesis protein MoaE n=1 Tax=Helicobacter sp. MIT 05-5294 TaxID=1548150 RepID=UPI0010FEF684|nr:molybdenum cofactor biosynthesis protein MoaE [Helicobacter sp. MIT 05-5294]TLD86023.1 molybdenum cofactor biosynthesis protein MoaE [Helicobacter sp. MIT 05-5294]
MQCHIEGLEIFEGALDTPNIYKNWFDFSSQSNLGANAIFTGIVRAENECEGLSFDIYLPLLEQWFLGWAKKALANEVLLKMAHSRGDVLNHQSSYMAGIFSSKRRATLEIFEDFIEDFKHRAPIWKYDLKDGQRIYAKERSYRLPYSGILN